MRCTISTSLSIVITNRNFTCKFGSQDLVIILSDLFFPFLQHPLAYSSYLWQEQYYVHSIQTVTIDTLLKLSASISLVQYRYGSTERRGHTITKKVHWVYFINVLKFTTSSNASANNFMTIHTQVGEKRITGTIFWFHPRSWVLHSHDTVLPLI